ncbi:MAG TPA: hypothetical protein VEL70_02885 [Candidatus Acidoferrum sp.]|nr:hypothetical protein [Candidatus Acidoferrum sp.]
MTPLTTTPTSKTCSDGSTVDASATCPSTNTTSSNPSVNSDNNGPIPSSVFNNPNHPSGNNNPPPACDNPSPPSSNNNGGERKWQWQWGRIYPISTKHAELISEDIQISANVIRFTTWNEYVDERKKNFHSHFCFLSRHFTTFRSTLSTCLSTLFTVFHRLMFFTFNTAGITYVSTNIADLFCILTIS